MSNPWWACYGRDYAAKTGHLTMLQHGAYFTLLNTYYLTGGPLPENAEHLTRICGAHSSEEIEALSVVLNSFFSLKADGWHNKRADVELREARRISKLRRNARLGKRKSIDISNDNQLCTQSQPHTHKEPKAKAQSAFELPTWVPQEAWSHYVEMRNRIRKPMTDQAKQWAVKLLARLRSGGNDPAAVLEQSVFNSWQGLFEVKRDGTHQHSTKQSRAREVASNNLAAAAAVGWSATHVGSVAVQGTDFGGTDTLEGEAKRLPE